MNTPLRNKMQIIISGIKDSTPIWLSFFFMFASIGAVSSQAQIGIGNTVLMTAMIFAAPVQLVIIYAINHSVSVSYLYIALTALIINFRFLLNSATLLPFFKQNKMSHILLAMMVFSASSFTVTLIEFKSGKIKLHHLEYFLSVAIPSYICAILSTYIGYLFATLFTNHNLQLIFTIVLPLHFAALTAKRCPQYKPVLMTIIGFLTMPLLLAVNINFIDVIFALGLSLLSVLVLERRTV